MLLAEEIIMLQDNYLSSLVQLKTLEKRLAKDPHLRNQYSKLSKLIWVKKIRDSSSSTYFFNIFLTIRCKPKQTW